MLKEPPADWQGESGYITSEMLEKILPVDAEKYESFLCGPKPMTDAAQQGLKARRVPLKQVHFELFDMV